MMTSAAEAGTRLLAQNAALSTNSTKTTQNLHASPSIEEPFGNGDTWTQNQKNYYGHRL
jgi:hypothetical protein